MFLNLLYMARKRKADTSTSWGDIFLALVGAYAAMMAVNAYLFFKSIPDPAQERRDKASECQKKFCKPDENWKTCFRRRSVEFHPDKNGGAPDPRMAELSECNNYTKND